MLDVCETCSFQLTVAKIRKKFIKFAARSIQLSVALVRLVDP